MGELMEQRAVDGRCPLDGTELVRETVGGRTTYWCPARTSTDRPALSVQPRQRPTDTVREAQCVSGGRPLAIRSTPKTRNSTAITAALCAVSQAFAESRLDLAFAPPTSE